MQVRETLRLWGKRAYGALNVWAVLPSGVVAVISAALGAGVHWITQFGAFGIFMCALVGFTLNSIALAQSAKWRLARLETKRRELVSGDSSPFDPMAPVYERKRLYLRDLAPMGRQHVDGKTFRNCEIIDPGTAVIGLKSNPSKPFPLMRNCGTYDVDCIEIDPAKKSLLAIAFVDCDFVDCMFYHMTLLFTSRDNETLHWITKDSRQLLLSPNNALGGGHYRPSGE